MKECVICGRPNSELHHIVFRGECKPIEKCKKNHVYLCNEHHRGTYGPHGHKGNGLNKKLKLKFQNWLEITLLKSEYKAEEISDILDISQSATERLLKVVKHNGYKYAREDVIRSCMGGKLILEGDLNGLDTD